MSEQLEHYFPFDEPRPEQKAAIRAVLNTFMNTTKRFFVLEAGTGVGKSAVAITVARVLDQLAQSGLHFPAWDIERQEAEDIERGVYIITTQKTLQEQYVSDYGGEKGCLKSIKSSSNYTCEYYTGQTCGESRRMLKTADKASDFYKACKWNCCYMRAKKAFMESTEGVTNFPYFLAETYYSGQLKPRELLVIDEAHNVEDQLSKFIEVTISERFARSVLKILVPKMTTAKQVVRWIMNEYRPKLRYLMSHHERMFAKYRGLKVMLDELKGYAKTYELMDKHMCKINRFLDIYDEENWVFNLIPSEGKSLRKFEFKPVDVSDYAPKILFSSGRRVLMMSATILNREAFCESLGIKEDEVEFVSIPSPFPPENRPVFYVPVGKMAKGNIDKTLPVLAATVKELLDQHAGEKGIIHCFDDATQVTLADRTQIAISDLKSGDNVLSYDERTHEMKSERVLNVFDRGVQECLVLEFENGKTVTCTPDHQFLTKNRGWVSAIELTQEDELFDSE